MKKIILTAMVCTAVLVAAACGKTEKTLPVSDEEPVSADSSEWAVTSKAVSAEAVTSEAASAEAVSAEAAEAPAVVHIISGNPEEISVDEDGKTVTVSLKGNATTGYEWNAEVDGNGVLEEVSAEYVPDDNEEGLTGVGGTWTARYAVKGDGKAAIMAVYARKWEADPIESRQITVTVENGRITAVENIVPETEMSGEADADDPENIEKAPAETAADTKTPETETADIAPIPEESAYIPAAGDDMGCLNDGLTW